LAIAPHKVPFKPGPFGPDGKIHPLPSQETVFHPEVETEQAEASKARAEAGMADLTTKPSVKVLSPDELKALKWSPANLLMPGSSLPAQSLGEASRTSHGAHRSTSPTSSASSKGFPGLTSLSGRAAPPDGGVAAGHVNVVAVTNSQIGVFDKTGRFLSLQSFSNFFSPVGTPAQDKIFDPRVVYDQDLQRFFVLATSENDSPQRSNYLLAVSKADDVSQGWIVYAFDATVDGSNPSSNYCDQPYLGIDSVAIYMSCNMYAFGSSFQYVKIRIMTKDELVNGPCCSWWDIWDLREGFWNLTSSFTVRPAVMHFSRDTDGDFWIDAGSRGGSDNTLHIWHLTNAANCCNGSGGPNIDESDDGVGDFGVAPGAVQPNGDTPLETGDTRVLYATWEFGHLSIGQTIACDQGGTTDACAAFTEIDTSGYPNLSNVNDWVWGGGTGENVFFPYVEQNSHADKTMVYTRSDGSSTYPGAYSVSIPNSSVCTNCISGETTLQAGSGNYVNLINNKNLWGDYMGAGADPDLLGIWVEGEYATTTITQWNTWIMPTYNTYAPIDSPSPSSLDFGNQAVFSEGGPQTVSVTNLGNATLHIGGVYISGDADFFLQSDGCTNATLQNGNSCQVQVSFAPSFVGPGSATLNVIDNTSPTGTTVPLSGTGVKAGTSTAVASSLNPSTVGQAVIFTAQVGSPTGTATGTVTFQDGAAVLGTAALSGSTASLSTSALGGGVHSITAIYNGDANFLPSTSPVLSQAVNPAPTATAVASSSNPSTFGQAVAFTSKVTSGAGTPTGTVIFQDGASNLGTGSLSGGTASFTTSALGGGSHSIKAVYNGTANFANSASGPLTQTVKKAASTTTVASSVNPSSFGQTVTFTAKVTLQFGGTVTGTVVFKDGATTLGISTISGGRATFVTSTLHVGSHPITAAYTGNSNLLGSTSATLTQVVHNAATTTALASSPNPSKSGQTVTFQATVTPAFAGTPTGSVTFRDNTTATVLGTAAVSSNRKAILNTSTLAVGTHSVSARYSGNTNFNPSTSSAINQVVNK
jgi:hypothetical protein